MIAAKPIAAISLAFALAASSSALASPAGSEYLPKEPKASHDSSNDGGSSTSGYSDTSTDYTYTQGSAGSSEGGHKPKHAQKKHDQVNMAPPVRRTTATGDTGGGNALLPLIVLLAAGGIVVVAGLLLRRWQTRHLAHQVGRPRQTSRPLRPSPATHGESAGGRTKAD